MPIFSHAQNFEDLRLWRALGHVGRGFYLDIGAQHPVNDSVSKLFYDSGWRGAHVEPTPAYAAMLREARSDEQVFEVAIGAKVDRRTFFEFPDTGMSTGIASIARQHSENGFPVRIREVPTVPLSTLFEDLKVDTIHWMKIDVEGMEREVLESWGTSPMRPWVLVIESVDPATRKCTSGSWIRLVEQRGYKEAAYDSLSRFFVLNEHEELAAPLAAQPSIFDDFRVTRDHFSAQQVSADFRSEIASRDEQLSAGDELRAQLAEVGQLTARLEQSHSEIASLRLQQEQMEAQAEAREEKLRQSIAERDTVTGELATIRARSAVLETRVGEAHDAMMRLTADLERARNEARASDEALHKSRLELHAAMEALEGSRAQRDELELSLHQLETAARDSERRGAALRRSLTSEFHSLSRSHSQAMLKNVDLEQTLARLTAARSDEEPARVTDDRASPAPEPESKIDAVPVKIGPQHSLNSASKTLQGAAVSETANGAPPVPAVLTVPQDERQLMTLDQLLSLHGEEFISQAYRILLNRDPDPIGFSHYHARLRRGESRVRILADLSASPEADRIQAGLPGLDSAVRGMRVRDALTLRPLVRRLFGETGENDAISRLRAIEARLVEASPIASPLSLQQHLAPPSPDPASPAVADEQVAAVPELAPVAAPAPPPPVVVLDEDGTVPASLWPEFLNRLFQRHWPDGADATADAARVADRQLWVVFHGNEGSVPATGIANLRKLRDAAYFDVEIGTLAPKIAMTSRRFKSLREIAREIPSDSLILFVGPLDQIDHRLAEVLIREGAWSKDFVLTDQSYEDNDRAAYVPFHGIDHVHLAHVDYISSRFLISRSQLEKAAAAGAVTPAEVARHAVQALYQKPGRRLHLPFPFVENGELQIEALKKRRRQEMRRLASVATTRRASCVDVLISTKDGGYLLDGLVRHLLEMPQIAHITVVSNNSGCDYTLDLLDRLDASKRCTVLRYDLPFNFSAQSNLAASIGKSPFLLFLNDDISLIGNEWLDYLLDHVDVEGDRIAGPLMLYGNQTIQHGGMYLAHNNTAGHAFRHQRHPHGAPMMELVAPRLVSCLTGACLVMKRSYFERLNGFDEVLATGLQDVDFSLRTLHNGGELVFDPRSIIFHLESVSLVPTLTASDVQRRREREYARFRDRWDSKLRPDRWHNPNFDLADERMRTIRVQV